jgi:hypothetical protein
MVLDSLRNILRKSMLKRIERNVESQQRENFGVTVARARLLAVWPAEGAIRKSASPCKRFAYRDLTVDRDGIEPPTQGFSASGRPRITLFSVRLGRFSDRLMFPTARRSASSAICE